ncbi:MAG: hypothetical protein JNL98_40730 [Bryobacterales bacterium]|nr:hypothetical protein [Bryobacterales bacterium]
MWDTGGLGKLFQSRLTPARLAGVVWGHAPQMWSSPEAADPPARANAADMLAYFFAAGYFEPIGDPGRGALRFGKLRCATCHSTGDVAKWNVIANPAALLHAMWQHRDEMRKAMDSRKMAWPSLSIDDMRDLLSLIAFRTGKANHQPQPDSGDAGRGRQLFANRECSECHRGILALDRDPFEHSLTELAAALWNHAPMLTRTPAPLSQQETSDILAYLWELRYFDEAGNALRGRTVFETHGCGNCHADPAKRTPIDSVGALRAVWSHYKVWKESRVAVWPRFTGSEMADLLAFWNARPSSEGK